MTLQEVFPRDRGAKGEIVPRGKLQERALAIWD